MCEQSDFGTGFTERTWISQKGLFSGVLLEFLVLFVHTVLLCQTVFAVHDFLILMYQSS